VTDRHVGRLVSRSLATLALALAVTGMWFLAGPILEEINMQPTNDQCMRTKSGAPDRSDPDCYASWEDGRNLVEEWDREHGNK
jgi:hypothetical protein